MNFNELPIDSKILKAIEEIGYKELTPIQEQTIPLILDNKDVLAEAPTGTGKTCAFALPLLEKIDTSLDKVQALVIVPTRELAIQVTKEIRDYYIHKEGCSSLPIYGGQNITRQIMLLKKHPNIIVSTPGRLLDHLERKTIRLNNLRYLVLDECDEMLDMGFKPDIEKVLTYVSGEHQTLMFSATISDEIKQISKVFQKEDKVFVKTERTKMFNEYIKQYYVRVPENEKKRTLTNILNGSSYKQCFIFVRTKTKVDHLSNILKIMGYNVTSIHGDMNQRQRDDSMKAFRNHEKDILVCTDVAARGLDIGNVDMVINYDLPDEHEYYLHRIGRTGRADGYGVAITFFMKSQMVLKSKFEAMTKDKIDEFKLYTKKEEEKNMAKQTLKNIENEVINSSVDDYESYVKEYLNDLNNNGENISPIKLAAVLLKELSKKPSVEIVTANEKIKENNKKTPKEDDKFEKPNDNTIRFFVNLGLKDGFKESTLKQLVIEKCGIDESHFEDVYCKESFSFVEVLKEDKKALMENLIGLEINDRKVNVEVSDKKPTRQERKRRGEEKDRQREAKKKGNDKRGKSNFKGKDKKRSNKRK